FYDFSDFHHPSHFLRPVKSEQTPNKIDHFLSDFNLFIPFEAIRFLPSLNHQGNGKKLLQGILSARF
ncbi:hypothetical protein WI973_26630, partial [Salmonella enterica subsp. enterica serovar Corvallis]